MGESFLDGRVVLHCGDCLDVLPTIPENSFDSFVGDPPYGLEFMGKHWDRGVPGVEYWREVLRVLKPGAHLLAFGGTRTYHRMACAIEDAGFEIRDQLQWLYGQGFPKSLDVSKAIDRAAGVAGSFGDHKSDRHAQPRHYADGMERPCHSDDGAVDRNGREYIAATAAARKWQGYGTALKPACEPIVLARKPLSESTVAANVLRWGTGALNIDGCRVAGEPTGERRNNVSLGGASGGIYGDAGAFVSEGSPLGCWPANVILSESDEVVGMFPDAPGQQAAVRGNEPSNSARYIFNGLAGRHSPREPVGDSGSAARFFYTSKADSDDRLGSKHPTVKPLDLMQYLVRLVTPKGGLVLDCFAGTGTTGEAAWREGMRAVLIEREPEYQNDIRRRMALCLAGPSERSRESMKVRMRDKPVDHGPLFGGTDESRGGGQTDIRRVC